MLDLSIAIVSWNVKDELRNCLESIRKNISGIAYEIIVIDNNSGDGSVEMVKKEYPEAILITNKRNFGYGTANNQGIRVAKGEYLTMDTVEPETDSAIYRLWKLQENLWESDLKNK